MTTRLSAEHSPQSDADYESGGSYLVDETAYNATRIPYRVCLFPELFRGQRVRRRGKKGQLREKNDSMSFTVRALKDSETTARVLVQNRVNDEPSEAHLTLLREATEEDRHYPYLACDERQATIFWEGDYVRFLFGLYVVSSVIPLLPVGELAGSARSMGSASVGPHSISELSGEMPQLVDLDDC